MLEDVESIVKRLAKIDNDVKKNSSQPALVKELQAEAELLRAVHKALEDLDTPKLAPL